MKLLIVNNNLQIGGVQKALVNLLQQLAGRYEITLLLFHAEGPLLQQLPPGITVRSVRSSYRFLGMTRTTARKPGEKLGRSVFAAITRLFGREVAVTLMSLSQKTLGDFDVAISFLHNSGDRAFYGGCNEFVLRHVRAAKKIAFLHCDYQTCGANTGKNARQYARFDRIAACSKGCAESFCRARPELAGKVCIVSNCYDFAQIRRNAQLAPVILPQNRLNIVTVARLGREKAVGRALEAIAALGKQSDQLRYYVIGDGVERQRLEMLAQTLCLGNSVVFCGELENPYGYMKAADLFLLPSRSEAAPLVIGEAACLGTPVLTTCTSSAQELVDRFCCGWVCENTVQGLTLAIKELARHPELLAEKRAVLAKREFSEGSSVRQFDRMLDGLGLQS